MPRLRLARHRVLKTPVLPPVCCDLRKFLLLSDPQILHLSDVRGAHGAPRSQLAPPDGALVASRPWQALPQGGRPFLLLQARQALREQKATPNLGDFFFSFEVYLLFEIRKSSRLSLTKHTNLKCAAQCTLTCGRERRSDRERDISSVPEGSSGTPGVPTSPDCRIPLCLVFLLYVMADI